jgi:hypothetical protein
VVLEFCAPNQRPVQVTTDLRGVLVEALPGKSPRSFAGSTRGIS